MCFCFDGENALIGDRPGGCRDRLQVASVRAPDPIASSPNGRNVEASFEPGDAEHSRRLAVVLKQMY
ncbi:hypothetical protein MJ8_41880 [Mesorhizobium sp. J8]|nr:hypothetical protein MJ8_41880 [Mesorhizobium sp. J8]